MKFMPKEDFWSPEFQSHYIAGLVYTIRPGNTKLAECAQRWKAEGKIDFLRPEQVGATVSNQPAPLSLLERIKSWL